ncbi:MAG: serine/threonine-protein kinase [Candidatus Margulisiibacteriota bacterium]
MPAIIKPAQISWWRHSIVKLDARAAQKPGLRQFGQVAKYLTPVFSSGLLASFYLATPGALTYSGLALYSLVGLALGLTPTRGVTKSLRLAGAERRKTEELRLANQQLDDLQGEKTAVEEKAARYAQEETKLRKLVGELQGRMSSMVNKLKEFGVQENEINEETFDGHNVFKRMLGFGGMAVAILVKNVDMDVEKVFKMPRPELLGNPLLLARFKGGEAKAMLTLNHQNVVRFFTLSYMKRETYLELLRRSGPEMEAEAESLKMSLSNIPEDIPYIEMEYVKGRDLSEVISAGVLETVLALKLAKDIAETLWYVGSKGIIHRDLKPGNIFLIPDEYQPGSFTIKIGDFGLAKQTDPSANKASINLTQMGVVMGTPQYMSPEQASGLPVDWRTDQYALGVILYEMLTGFLPYRGGTIMMDQQKVREYIYKILSEPPVDIRTIRDDIPESLAKVVHKMLEKERDKRFPTWEACVFALQSAAFSSAIGDEATSV